MQGAAQLIAKGPSGRDVICEPLFRVYQEYEDGTLDDLRDTYDITQFAGVLPAPGDVIVSGLISKDRQHEPETWILHEVVRRYFKPVYPSRRDEQKGKMTLWVVLVVKERRGRAGEEGILLGG